jgi:acetyl-CoA carboxylase, biotin carboxylase subunit
MPEKTFKKLLVANRGEIALRIIRTCREMGIRSVAVYSEADRDSLHVRWADEAYCIGAPPSSESYLRIDAILDAVKKSGAEAIHPGYGFLAENGEFADACEAAGAVFVGPTGDIIRAMGDKIEARALMTKAGVPIMPGTDGEIGTPQELDDAAEKIGFPMMIKASGGGGGKGIRIVHNRGEMRKAFDMARSEAQNAFGNAAVYVERYLKNPRHIEFQVMADNMGGVIHLCERECSIQRRHQKIIEETPSPLVDGEMRRAMGEVAVQACRAIGYRNAGTIEFLVDEEKNFYFLEMNTRLQVEHPVTEQVTGVNLVRLQLVAAAGNPLPIGQEDVVQRGHSIEARIYAEDPDAGFMPAIGRVTSLDVPGGIGVRLDSALFEGMEISLFYDPMLAKLAVSGSTRDRTIDRLRRCLGELHISGVKTNVPFLLATLETESFRKGDYHTGYVEENLSEILKGSVSEQSDLVALAAAVLSHAERKHRSRQLNGTDRSRRASAWTQAFRPGR